MADKKNRVPVREQAPEVRAKNFDQYPCIYRRSKGRQF